MNIVFYLINDNKSTIISFKFLNVQSLSLEDFILESDITFGSNRKRKS